MTSGYAVMVVAQSGDFVETKVSRVYKKAAEAEAYKKGLEKDIKEGKRPDVLCCWIQSSVRIY